MAEYIIKWIPVLAGVATVLALVLVYRQLKLSENHAKITRSNQIIDLYHTYFSPMSDEIHLEEASKIYASVNISDPFNVIPNKEDLMRSLRPIITKERFKSFYIILGVYWYHDLIDKSIIKKLIPIESDYEKYEKDINQIKEKYGKNIYFYWDYMIREIKDPKKNYDFNEVLKSLSK